MKHRRSQSDQCRRDKNDCVLIGDAQEQQSEEGGPHADRERERLRLLVGEMSDHRLQQRCGELERQRDHSDLREVERVAVFKDRIDRRDQRLHRVVEEVRKTDSRQHDIGRACRSGCGSAAVHRIRRQHRRGQCFFGDGDRLVQGGSSQIDSRRGLRCSYDSGARATTTINR